MHLEFVEPSKRCADVIVPTGINQVSAVGSKPVTNRCVQKLHLRLP